MPLVEFLSNSTKTTFSHCRGIVNVQTPVAHEISLSFFFTSFSSFSVLYEGLNIALTHQGGAKEGCRVGGSGGEGVVV